MVCKKCKKEKGAIDFYKKSMSMCKDCVKESNKSYKARKREKILKDHIEYNLRNKAAIRLYCEEYYIKNKERLLLKRYNITLEAYKKLYERQNGRCFICQREVDLVVDHCHETGEVRGLLCKKHNSAIGFMEDNIVFLERAIEYLRGGSRV